ncbi:DUF202 domain-containing protein [Rhodococcus opacus]|uniref:DUF202 domain-containing protein n=1 Tax=Rhodococcus opacus TaxID=37919 RepID=A0A076EHT3_RHOOP|nr:DUF202 domain-containing protein [Rhodococcus opacus]AII05755.1 hypothetical protein EP51_14590 [Rhodococcus opacus]
MTTTHGDAGLQPERTSLAWVRTSLALGAVAVLCSRCLPTVDHDNRTWSTGVPLATLMLAAVLLVSSPRHRRALCADFTAGRARPTIRRAVGLVITVTSLAVAATITIL